MSGQDKVAVSQAERAKQCKRTQDIADVHRMSGFAGDVSFLGREFDLARIVVLPWDVRQRRVRWEGGNRVVDADDGFDRRIAILEGMCDCSLDGAGR